MIECLCFSIYFFNNDCFGVIILLCIFQKVHLIFYEGWIYFCRRVPSSDMWPGSSGMDSIGRSTALQIRCPQLHELKHTCTTGPTQAV